MIDRIKLNWEAMNPASRRKVVLYGIIISAIVLFITVAVIQEIASGSKKREAVSDEPTKQVTEIKKGRESLGITGVVQENAAYERKQLKDAMERHQSIYEQDKKINEENIVELSKKISRASEKIDKASDSIYLLSESIANERQQRRAENELIVGELDRLGRSNRGGSIIAGGSSGEIRSLGSSGAGGFEGFFEEEVIELSPFDLLSYTDLSGIPVNHVGYSYVEATKQQPENGAEGESEARSTVSSNQNNRNSSGYTNTATRSQQQTNSSTKDEGEVNPNSIKDEDGLNAYDRGEVTTVPAGSLITAVLVSGLDAPIGQTGASNPHPIMAKVTGRVLLPNKKQMDLRGCVLLASGNGDLSTEKVYLRTTTLSCIDSENNIFETSLEASGLGADGKVGIRGTMVTRDGALVARNMQAGLLQGLAVAFQGGNQSFNVTTERPYELPDADYITRSMIGQGVNNSLDTMIQRYNKLLDQIFPFIEISAGRKVEFQVLSKFDVRVKK